jgi:hypothetical protein
MADARGGRRVSAQDDIPDPMGRPLKVHQETGERIADAMLLVLGHLVGSRRDLGRPSAHAATQPELRPRGWLRGRS